MGWLTGLVKRSKNTSQDWKNSNLLENHFTLAFLCSTWFVLTSCMLVLILYKLTPIF